MKTKPFIRRTFVIAISVVLISSLNFQARAQTSDTTPVDFRYIGKLDDQPLFQLNIFNPDNDEYTVKIFDEDGYVFYYYTVRSKNFKKRFQLETDELPKGFFNVEIRSKKKSTVESYRVTKSTRFVQETSVTKL
jgi:hypothetical protein